MQSWFVYAFVASLALASYLAKKPNKVRIVTVIDGDTCMGVDTKGVRRKLRLYGVDAPETGQRLSAASKGFLEAELLGRWSKVRWKGRDRYRRFVVRLDGRGGDVSAGLLRRGLAYPTEAGGMALHSMLARLTFRGVWLIGSKPHDSLKRKHRIVGWTAWKFQTAKRKKRSRSKARPR